ncbi:MAG: tetratricopeptide repeat protein, partial [Actinomycetota bacterium]|nr:tetratricopeptide repeat protein [Actinomycetota bacterium]
MARRQVEVYAQGPDAADSGSGWSCGSGYLLDDALVLTAAHVVCTGGDPCPTVSVLVDGAGQLRAQVLWYRYVGEVDVALLEITEVGWVAPVWRHPVRWGRLVTSLAGQSCEAIGFPRVVATPRRRDSHHATGVINPGSLVKAGLYAMEVHSPPTGPDADGSRWAGMSGAAVLCQNRVVGVITRDPAGFDSHRLITVPVSTVLADPTFQELITQHRGRAPEVEPVELIGLAESVVAADSPAGLLRADVADTPFRPRAELDLLRGWCAGPGWSSIRLVTGPGGQGKTRLAYHLAEDLTGRGWAAVMLTERATSEQISVLGQVQTPTLVVVDYAEGRAGQLEAVLAALGQAEARVRLLLLARTAGAWRTERLEPSPLLEPLADERIVLPLSPLEPSPDGRVTAWRQACAALAVGLTALDVAQGIEGVNWVGIAANLPSPVLAGPTYRTILAVQMDALAALLQAGEPITGAGRRPEQVLLAHERRYWGRVARRFEVGVDPARQECLVAMATLWGATDAVQAHNLLTASSPGGSDPQTRMDAWLGALYQDGHRHWGGLQPDRLAEYFIGGVLSPPVRCAELLTGMGQKLSPEQLEHGLTVLGRAAPYHPHLVESIAATLRDAGQPAGIAALAVALRLEQPEPLLHALDSCITTADLPALQALSDVLPRSSMLLAPTSLRIAECLVIKLRDAATDRDAYLPNLAGSVHNLAVRLAEVGRRAEGLTAAQEAVDLRRELLESNRDAYLPNLAMSVNNLAIRLGEAGRRAEGLTAAQEAVDLYRELVESNRDAYLPDLAMS